MKLLLFFCLILISKTNCFADLNKVAPDTKWTHSWSEGEDATSTFYYYIEDRGGVKKIRLMWNGGAQQKPSITDYIFESGVIKVVVQEAARENIADLTLGKNAGLKTLSEFKILRRSSEMMLVPEPPRKTLSKSERMHLNNIIHLLLENRQLYKLPDHPSP